MVPEFRDSGFPGRKCRILHQIVRTTTWLFLCAAPTLSETVFSQDRFSQEELIALPRVCHAQRVINNQLQTKIVPEAERRQWALRLGEKDYSSFHHYCWALIYLRRASAAETPQSQVFNYETAVNNFGFIQTHASPDFPLMPEVNLRKGQTHRLLGEDAAAAKEFTEAIQLKPDYTPAYAALVDFYLDLQDLQRAEEILAQGLVHAPQSRILLQKKAEMESQQSRK
jgi:tetratricopeptide (TPR) repeat protein